MTAPLGHNSDPFTVARDTVADLMLEARQALDGTPATDCDTADYFAGLLDMARKAERTADDARKEEKRPHDDAAKAVQARYAPLLADTERVQKACKAALLDWQRKEQARIDAEAAAAREAAAQAAREAAEAYQAANSASLEAQEAAERKLADAAALQRAADKAEAATAGAKGVYAARKTALVTRRVAVSLDNAALVLAWAKQHRPDELKAALLKIVQAHKGGDVAGVVYEDVSEIR